MQNDLVGWIIFFLNGVIDVAEKSASVFKK